MEHCLVQTVGRDVSVTSTIVGCDQGKIYKVDYAIQLNKDWEVLSFEIECHHHHKFFRISSESDGKGNWISDGKTQHQFKGCIDIDIPLTPFTNTLPIRRLQLDKGGEGKIQVLYLDLLAQEIRSVQQRYQRLSEDLYHYENVPNDFEADIRVDEFGFVVNYPTLFTLTKRSS